MSLPSSVTVVEVGPRDGLQNEPGWVPTADKLRFIELLADSGLNRIEAGAFVHPKWVPQMRDAAEVFKGLPKMANVSFSALVPNEKGMEAAMAAGVTHVAVVTAASETFNQRNLNASTAETLRRVEAIANMSPGTPIRGYLSTSFVCPYEGPVAPDRAADLVKKLVDLGCQEIAISDTLGVATTEDVSRLLDIVLPNIEAARIALHLHDTFGRAIDNVACGLDYGITVFDSSAGGLGGCPFAPGAPGNLASEKLVAYLHSRGIVTGVEEAKVALASQFIRKTCRLEGPGT